MAKAIWGLACIAALFMGGSDLAQAQSTAAAPLRVQSTSPYRVAQSSTADQLAEDDARARELYENGAVLYAEGRYEAAIVAWQEAYRLSGRPLLLYNLANAQERSGDWQDAVDSLNHYRALAPADERETLERRIRNLEARIAANQRLLAPPPTQEPEVDTPAVAQSDVLLRDTQDPMARAFIAPAATAIGAGVFAVAGVYYGLQHQRSLTLARQGCTPFDGMYICTQEAQDWIERADMQALATDINFTIAGVGGVVAGVLYMRARNQGQAWRLQPQFGAKGFALAWHREF